MYDVLPCYLYFWSGYIYKNCVPNPRENPAQLVWQQEKIGYLIISRFYDLLEYVGGFATDELVTHPSVVVDSTGTSLPSSACCQTAPLLSCANHFMEILWDKKT